MQFHSELVFSKVTYFVTVTNIIRTIQATAGSAGHLSQDTNFFQPFHISLRRPGGYTHGSLKLADFPDGSFVFIGQGLRSSTPDSPARLLTHAGFSWQIGKAAGLDLGLLSPDYPTGAAE